LRGRPELRDRAERGLGRFFDGMQRIPTGMCAMLQALDFHLRGPREVVLVEPAEPAGAAALRDTLRSSYLANSVRVLARAGDERVEKLVPLTENRLDIDDKATAYICFEGACRQPATEADTLREQLLE